ncbi:hypothetical protein BB558_000930 [Smittium angustum]|uniref:Holocytochrome c-type synthase n=1 Tax=Smittium angustum TaxID=133377 RepID=A0A2U1JD32_SMIAN|nr:hypothetical protein BB558_004161 [Smittium angustum]PWA02919.1 hypothetical protein BB558_000930 [Smittium angustum]
MAENNTETKNDPEIQTSKTPTNKNDSIKIDPTNKMPTVPQQSVIYQQKTALSTTRNFSTIPKADRFESAGPSACPHITENDSNNKKPVGDIDSACPVHNTNDSQEKTNPTTNQTNNKSDDVWIYPSEQMFFNAMKRKNWNANEEDMKVIVPMHNAVNEMCWKKILEWESMHETQCKMPKLLRFEGNAKELTIKARFKTWLGYKPPFDRHDWTVDRCGKKVRYIIDFYGGHVEDNKLPFPSFYLDVRPAPTVDGIYDRVKRWWFPSSAQIYSNKGVTAGINPESLKK